MAEIRSSRKRAPSPSAPLQAARRRLQSDCDLFLSLLAEADCTVAGSDSVLLGSGDIVRLQHQLALRLKQDQELLSRFLAGLEAHIQDDENLRRFLRPMSSASKGRLHTADSLARVMLTVAPLQNKVASILLERLPLHLEDDDAESTSSLTRSIPRLILSQFHWLDYLVDSKELTKKLLEVLSICPLNLKKEIISFLPEVITDGDHEMVMQNLEQLLEENLQLIVPVLDAFSNINLEEGVFEQVVAIALSSLRSVDAEDLPLVVKFLLQSANASNMKQISRDLRANLNFINPSDARSAKPDMKMKGKSNSSSCEALVLETIRTGLRFQNAFSEAFLKEIKDIEGERNHKVIDFWLLLVIHANAGVHRRVAEALLLRKVISRDFGKLLLTQAIQGHSKALQDYYRTLLIITEALVRSKETIASQFAVQAYLLLFEEFTDTYYRQEVLGSLITHTVSGMPDEVSSALDALVHLALKHSNELLPFSAFLNGILDYLEGFQIKHLHQVYTMFCKLAVASWSSALATGGSSMGDKLIMLIRKQLMNVDFKYKRMGIIGAIKLVSCLAAVAEGENVHSGGTPMSGVKEALSLLQMTDEMCKVSVIARGFFYDELTLSLETTSFNTAVIEWVSRCTNDFETVFLGDLEAGQIKNPLEESSLEGELWFNLDGDISPICINILSQLMSTDQSTSSSLLFLPSCFRLLATVESLSNEGSLGGIDALLGCPIYLPKKEVLVGDAWLNTSRRHKELSCIALFHAINWIRELVNAFSTQIAEQGQFSTQITREEVALKLCQRIRNLLLLEHLLNECMKAVPYLKLPRLLFLVDAPDETRMGFHTVYLKQESLSAKKVKKGHNKLGLRTTINEGKSRDGISQETQGEKMKQSGISDAFGGKNTKASEGSPQINRSQYLESVDSQNTGGSLEKSCNQDKSTEEAIPSTNANVENGIRSCIDLLEAQKWKLRPLSLSSLSILTLYQVSKVSCCADPNARLPLVLYVLRDFLNKLEICLDQQPKKSFPFSAASVAQREPVFIHMRGLDFLIKVKSVLASLRAHMDTASHTLEQFNHSNSQTTCDEHWTSHSSAAGNPSNMEYSPSRFRVAESVFTVLLQCLNKILTYAELRSQENVALLKELLLPFCVTEESERACEDMPTPPPTGSVEFIFCRAYSFLDGLFDTASRASFGATTELLMVLKSLVDFAVDCEATSNRKRRASSVRPASLVPQLRTRLSKSARKMLQHDWDTEEQGKIWRSKGEVLQKVLIMMIQNQESTAEILMDLSSNVLPQVPSRGGRGGSNALEGFPALSSATFITWYRVLHGLVLENFSKVVKDILIQNKAKAVLGDEVVEKLLNQAHRCVSIHVALVNLTRKHDQIPVHATAVKCGGRFVDNFLKGLDFLQSYYAAHKDAIIALVKELQKATRIIQTICAEAKGQKKMPVTCKVPAVKRSMERYVFCIKALLHGASNGTSFWMGNLKHKDLQGQEVASQLHASDDEAADEQDPEADPEHASDEQSPSAQYERISDPGDSCQDIGI